MEHANAVLYSLYHFLPLRNAIFSSPILTAEEYSEETTSGLSSLQLVFAKMCSGGQMNLAFLLQNSYLADEGFEASNARLPEFIDPSVFFSWSIRKLAEADPAIKAMFFWKFETLRRFADAEIPIYETVNEAIYFDIDMSAVQSHRDLQSYLECLINGVESHVVQQLHTKALERTVIDQIRFTQLPSILTFRIAKSDPNNNLDIPEILDLGVSAVRLYALVASSAMAGNFITFVREEGQWTQFESDKAPSLVSFERVQQAFANAHLLFYSKPEFMEVSSIVEPSIDLRKKCTY
jgi:hypothetical protein